MSKKPEMHLKSGAYLILPLTQEEYGPKRSWTQHDLTTSLN